MASQVHRHPVRGFIAGLMLGIGLAYVTPARHKTAI